MNPDVSLDKTLNYFRENGIDVSVEKKPTAKNLVNQTSRSNMCRSHVSLILKSPLYVRANAEVYQYLVSKGFEIIDDVEAFDGVHGLFRHKRSDGSEYVKVGYHEGLVDADTWLTVQDKKSRNQKIPNNCYGKHSWLVGLTKCGECGYSLSILYGWNVDNTVKWRSYRDRGMYTGNGCIQSTFNVRPDEVERIVFDAMKERLDSLVISKAEKVKPDTEVENLKAEIIRVDDEIHKLMDKLANADATLFEYIQNRIKTLHAKKSELDERLRSKARKHKEIDTAPLTEPMSRWDELSVDERHALAVTMIDVVYISDEHGIDIRFCI